MKINFVANENGPLFSFHRHDFKQDGEGENYIMIDGGWDYTRYSGILDSAEIKDMIKHIREQFMWTNTVGKDGSKLVKPITKYLKDLDTDHIYSILRYFTERIDSDVSLDKAWTATHLFFIEELIYRFENKIN